MTAMLLSLQKGLISFLCPKNSFLTRSVMSRAARRPLPAKRDPARLNAESTPIPYPADTILGPEDFLKAIGREAHTKMTVGTWEELWRMDGQALRKAGVAIRDRRYLLWCMEKYRLGFPIREFAHEAPAKKIIRGWGPKVQNGKRIRSRRLKDKTKQADTKYN